MKRLLIVTFLLFVGSPAFAEDEDLHMQLMRATVKISHDQSTASGFILFKGQEEGYVLVTAAHVFEKTPGFETTVVFRSKVAEGEYKKEPTQLVIRKNDHSLWQKHPTEDVAAIAVVPPQNADFSVISTALLATDDSLRKQQISPGQRLAILGYPHREEGSEAGFAILRDGPISTFPLLPTVKTKNFSVSTNTFEGDSGAPAYLVQMNKVRDSDLKPIVGIVTGQRMLDEDLKTLYGSTTLRHRFGLAIVVHASFIAETIDLLMDSRSKRSE